ncbi:hypothetical protein AK830_g9546 [Neonectria ditissima]|uniref:Uncharacterized protein n=1 Tax=Neonectria ditissima TaxID=78410 RepID=A0A0P7BC69_9HYPO|nr:hypothetical protein AK830_g9546 [Neonectria ditissima]
MYLRPRLSWQGSTDRVGTMGDHGWDGMGWDASWIADGSSVPPDMGMDMGDAMGWMDGVRGPGMAWHGMDHGRLDMGCGIEFLLASSDTKRRSHARSLTHPSSHAHTTHHTPHTLILSTLSNTLTLTLTLFLSRPLSLPLPLPSPPLPHRLHAAMPHSVPIFVSPASP